MTTPSPALKHLLTAALLCVLACGMAVAQAPTAPPSSIRLNQLGYYPTAPKRAFVVGAAGGEAFRVVAQGGSEAVYEGRLSPKRDYREQAGEVGAWADFSALTQPGSDYVLEVQGHGTSYPFAVGASVYAEALPASVKSYYFQRAGTPVSEAFGGAYARPAGHPDDRVRYHRTSGRDTTATHASPGGWYDAGDYNKYIVNAGYSVGVMLQLLDQFGHDVLADGSIAFPESGNGRNDLLDELKYELDWMLTMQDPADGGVHHKLTTENFEGMVMPHEATAPRYILAKSTTASYDFAACMALASRVFAKAPASRSKAGEAAYAKTCLDAAERAFAWAADHPDAPFKNPAGVRTGEYGDADAGDERMWALAELWVTTGQPRYARPFFNERVRIRFEAGENWTGYMANLAAFSLLEHADEIAAGQPLWRELTKAMRRDVLAVADGLLAKSDTTAYRSPVTDWHWGSSSDVLGAATFMVQAYRLTGEPRYLAAARAYTDLVFGLNATGYSWVTGFGARTPMNIHHRPSAADGVAAPVPGFVVGGPNSRQQDVSNDTVYPVAAGEYPMRSYADQEESYASNEVCLNWNAPLVYVLGALEAYGAK